MERLLVCIASIPYNFIKETKILVAIIRNYWITRIQRTQIDFKGFVNSIFFASSELSSFSIFNLVINKREMNSRNQLMHTYIHTHMHREESLRSLDRAIFARLCGTCTRPNSYVLFITVSTSGCWITDHLSSHV